MTTKGAPTRRNINESEFAFEYEVLSGISRLGWLAQVEKDNRVVKVVCGPWVETHEEFFVEGAWCGEFSKGRFDKSIGAYGSGGLLTPSSVIFASPTHTRERIYSVKHKSRVYVSNSVVFLLHRSGEELDEKYNYYKEDLETVELGIKDYERRIPLKSGNDLHLYCHCNMEIDAKLGITETQKAAVEDEFVDYSSYKRFLEDSITSIFANANDPKRKIKYEPVTTLSSGYDSACCSVLAKRCGCNEALTLVKGAVKTDSGTTIAQKLGLDIKEIDTREYLNSKRKFIEAEIFSAGFATQGTYILSLEEYLPARLLITGYQGDIVWEKNHERVNSNIENGGGGSAWTEFRLRVGFIHFIVPHLGATKMPSIHRISNSSEMSRWSSGISNRDRPIPTRIVMEEGVPREIFGLSKDGSGVYPSRTMVARLRKLLRSNAIFNRIKKGFSGKTRARLRKIEAVVTHNISLLLSRKRKTMEYDSYKDIMKEESLNDLFSLYQKSRRGTLSTFMFLWGVEKTKDNYS
ncbi:MAG: hypothetical protein JSW58_11710 [Candidatus Latescibacterota bacterium]|nr:MAG: hypothetical protein JSW58_11710 [Candidatus Latescibacterota bacterium]